MDLVHRKLRERFARENIKIGDQRIVNCSFGAKRKKGVRFITKSGTHIFGFISSALKVTLLESSFLELSNEGCYVSVILLRTKLVSRTRSLRSKHFGSRNHMTKCISIKIGA